MHHDLRVRSELASRAAVIAGDETVWRVWYNESYEPLQRFVYWRLGSQHANVDEVIQETWLIAVRRIRDFDPQKGSFIDWLCGIAGNLIRNHSRNRQSAQCDLKFVTDGAVSGDAELQIEAEERSARVASALSALPDDYAAVLQAKYLEQRSVNDIAQAWNQSAKAIESLLSRARSAFRKEFGDVS